MEEVNLPGTEDTVIKEAVPPGGAHALHLAWLKLAISPNVGNSGAQFLVVGDCVRASPDLIYIQLFLKVCGVLELLQGMCFEVVAALQFSCSTYM